MAVFYFKLKKLIEDFIYSNLFISTCAVAMCWFTIQVFNLEISRLFYIFIFFGTLCSYSFHWYLTPSATITHRGKWSYRNQVLLGFLAIFSFIIVCITFFYLRAFTIYLLPLTILTFLYTAPKINRTPFLYLRKIAVAKTLYLSAMWTIITTLLPLWVANQSLGKAHILFIINRFLLIWAICILFDYRDRIEDKMRKVKNLITYFTPRNLDILFTIIQLGFFISAFLFYQSTANINAFICLVIPAIILIFCYSYSKNTQSDYWFYFVLDGLFLHSSIVYLILFYR